MQAAAWRAERRRPASLDPERQLLRRAVRATRAWSTTSRRALAESGLPAGPARARADRDRAAARPRHGRRADGRAQAARRAARGRRLRHRQRLAAAPRAASRSTCSRSTARSSTRIGIDQRQTAIAGSIVRLGQSLEHGASSPRGSRRPTSSPSCWRSAATSARASCSGRPSEPQDARAAARPTTAPTQRRRERRRDGAAGARQSMIRQVAEPWASSLPVSASMSCACAVAWRRPAVEDLGLGADPPDVAR